MRMKREKNRPQAEIKAEKKNIALICKTYREFAFDIEKHYAIITNFAEFIMELYLRQTHCLMPILCTPSSSHYDNLECHCR